MSARPESGVLRCRKLRVAYKENKTPWDDCQACRFGQKAEIDQEVAFSSSRVGRRPVRNSFDHLVGAAEQRERNGEPERPGGLEIDDQLDLRCLLHRQVGRLLALKDAAGIDADQSERVRKIGSVAHQASCRSELAKLVRRGQRVAVRQCGELFEPARKERSSIGSLASSTTIGIVAVAACAASAAGVLPGAAITVT